MGNRPSIEQYYEDIETAKRCINQNTPIKIIFPGFLNNEQKFLKYQQRTATTLQNMSTLTNKLITHVGIPAAGGPVLKALIFLIHESPESIERALTVLKVEKMIAQTVHSLVEAKFKCIERELSKSFTNSTSQRKIHLAIVDSNCYEILCLFDNPTYYFHRDPLAYAPFLVSFVAVYIAVIRANYSFADGTDGREDIIHNLKKLKKIITDFRDKTCKERMKLISWNVPFGRNTIGIKDSLINKEIYVESRSGFGVNSLDFEHTSSIGNNISIIHSIEKWYTSEISRKYAEYFGPTMKAVSKTLDEI
jgi:hypothetical protein